MQLGMHLPHAGSQATPALIKRHAQRSEALGLSDVWVSEHIIVPRAQFPRSPLFYDPILTLTWVASVTERVRLGTSVIVLPPTAFTRMSTRRNSCSTEATVRST